MAVLNNLTSSCPKRSPDYALEGEKRFQQTTEIEKVAKTYGIPAVRERNENADVVLCTRVHWLAGGSLVAGCQWIEIKKSGEHEDFLKVHRQTKGGIRRSC